MALQINIGFWIRIEETTINAPTDQDRAMRDDVLIKWVLLRLSTNLPLNIVCRGICYVIYWQY